MSLCQHCLGAVRVLEIGPDESRVALGAEPAVAARHVELDEHVITLLMLQIER